MLTFDEQALIQNKMQRALTEAELSVFGAMWSEHCSYKSSKLLLKKLYTDNKNVLAGPGENAGVVSLGGSDKIAFKIESHNHPSYIMPFQGAATGVGGILRDIFTMGFRPIALSNMLCFGNPKSLDVQKLQQGVVDGLTYYGNCIGVPTVETKCFYADCYEQNPIVNAMAIGYTNKNVFSNKPKKLGKVFYVGAKTGRDGIGGATMASESISSKDNRPTVQVGDPYLGKLLIEACLELFDTGFVVAAQDMGAAGLTSSSIEIATRGSKGIILDLDSIPLRESNMEAWEILLSESQERMLFVLDDKHMADTKALEIFAKWDLDCVEIGKLIEEPVFIVNHKDKEVCNIPLEVLDYDYREMDIKPVDVPRSIRRTSYSDDVIRKPFYSSEFDSDVLGNTVLSTNSDRYYNISIVKVTDKKSLCILTECAPYECYINPKQGIEYLICSMYDTIMDYNAKPLAITNCLNFGNPNANNIMWEFDQTIEGMKFICEKLDVPVVSGNVSFYNETVTSHFSTNILPTPVITMIGLLEE